MEDVTTVIPEVAKVAYTQSRQTKLGLAVVTINQEGDLYESTVTITYGDTIFKATGIFASETEAGMWSYGVKQNRNDRYAGYTVKDGMLIETKPAKNKIAHVLSIKDALLESQSSYNTFSLAKSTIAGDKVSMNAVRTSTLLSDEDKAIMASLFAKMGKVSQ